MNMIDIVQHFPIIALSLIAVFGARAATIYPLLAATTKFTRENIPNVWKQAGKTTISWYFDIRFSTR
jgi:hypothetical protein